VSRRGYHETPRAERSAAPATGSRRGSTALHRQDRRQWVEV
jgi:hypothetical protein